ncbi:TPA: tRNA adenosine(34) deaminase TadA [Candidatus Poribacteria bacterium]|jgi:tRNA(adenine34) deaminase|nr:tRNA adenosine(34) deaminase TadA [Candidatus Poribacteria bacterium]HIA68432.1 tRNA adenosine(34) deaminase TadA [Candidatus Poribacteria bacterium]HIB91448.1 tRNA adenosine(34) deaminase TadA [Candidatus Poribacteria bacterium]HIC02734.1 tRNA adenosine(34) deaminase TadA [Candidatus Poribacteria bacterium]HIM09316.1 tRNA adenosine(34) deaminase TadA [Candidatus Poribacteria bacterium]
MREALSLARRAAQAGEVPVGAIVVKNDIATARAYNTRQQSKDPTAHAEILVIQRASMVTGDWRLIDTTLYVTLEPCPMCAGAILASRIPRVVYGAADSKAGAVDSLFGLLNDRRLNHQVEVRSGVLAEESSRLLKSFFGKRRQQISERCESG